MLTAYFYHKVTWLPLTDPLVTVSVTLANMNNDTKVLDNAQMSPSSSIPGAFRNPYELSHEIDYMAYYSCSDDNYGEKTTQYYFPSSRSGGGGGSINISGIQATIRNSYDKISTEFDKKLIEMREEIRNEFNETNSHIDVAKTDVIDTIKAIEIPKTDLTKITDSLGTLKMTLTKLSQFVRSEAEKDKVEEKKKMSEEYESKIAELLDKIEEMEDVYEELDLSIADKEKLIEDMEKTAQEIVDELEKEKELARNEWEKSVKEKLISSLSE